MPQRLKNIRHRQQPKGKSRGRMTNSRARQRPVEICIVPSCDLFLERAKSEGPGAEIERSLITRTL